MRGQGAREEHRREIAIDDGRQSIGRGERPVYRALVEEASAGGYVVIDETFTAEVSVDLRTQAADAIRGVIAELLGVSPLAIDIEVETGR
jgi:hypothetical protein